MKGANSPCELMPGRWLGGKQLAALCAHFGYFPATNLDTHRELTDRRWTDSDAIISYCFNWRPQGDSNPCYRRERAMSWASRRSGRGQAAGRARKITRPAPEQQCAGPIRATPPAVVARRAARQPQTLYVARTFHTATGRTWGPAPEPF